MANTGSPFFNHLAHLSNQLFDRLESAGKRPFWWIWVALVCSVLSLLFSFPDYSDPANEQIWGALQDQIAAPFTPRDLSATTHQSKHAFRLTMPVLGYVTGMGVVGLLVVQHILGFFFFGVVARVVDRLSGDRVLAWLLTLAFAFVYVGKAPFFDKVGWFDGVAFFFLATALFCRKWWWIGMAIFLAAWTDERAVLASGLVYLFHSLANTGDKPLHFQRLIPRHTAQIAILLAGLSYGLGRYLLQTRIGLSIPIGSEAGAGPALIRLNYGMFPLGFLTSIEFLWLAIGLGVWAALRSGAYLFSLAWLANMGVIVLVSYMVHDTTRSGAYVFPAVFIAYLLLNKSESPGTLRFMTLIMLILCFVFATHFVMHQNPAWISPFFPKILEYL